jgi:hypothetical protein
MYIFISEGFPQTAFNGVTVNNTEKGGFLKFQRARERERERARESQPAERWRGTKMNERKRRGI